MKEHLQEGEQILHVARPTRITLVPLIVAIVLLIVATWMLFPLLQFIALIGGFILITIAVVYLAVRLVVLGSYQYLLTDRRVVKQTGIFNKSSTDAYLDKINNVEHRQTMWGRMLNYGDVEIDTASETGMTSFPNISAPFAFKRAILEASEAYRSGRNRVVTAEASGAQKIRDLKALLDEGLISAEEYEAKRKKLLDGM
jgi:uncharacterized membrane protein YdbT with pleckstrin-like domain